MRVSPASRRAMRRLEPSVYLSVCDARVNSNCVTLMHSSTQCPASATERPPKYTLAFRDVVAEADSAAEPVYMRPALACRRTIESLRLESIEAALNAAPR
jgi:hypothetical protein